MTEAHAKHPEESAAKRPYRVPVLTVFGALADLTANVGSTSNLDGGTGTMMRSQ